MDSKGVHLGASVIAGTLLLVLQQQAFGAEVPVTVLKPDGAPLPGAIVVLEPATPALRARAAAVPVPSGPATMDQRELSFVPDTLVIRTGSSVDFPNGDKVRHQVYSFSGAKTFKLALYAGRAHPPVAFDKPGVVTLGCNIHDGMIGYILVTDSPWSGRTDARGVAQLNVPEGAFTVRIWHPRITDAPDSLLRSVQVADAHAEPVTFQLARKLKPELHNHGTNQKWEDY